MPNYTARTAALKSVLLGSKPISSTVYEITHKFEVLTQNNAFKVGPIEKQYQVFLEESQSRRRSSIRRASKVGRRISSFSPNERRKSKVGGAGAAPDNP